MRTSKRGEILNAAVELIEADGLEAISYESLAEASGMSKSGIIYHFPSRHQIMRGLHEHMAHTWEDELITAAGGTAEEVTEADRLRAMVLTLSRSATKTELLLEIDARNDPELNEIWLHVDERWAPSSDGIDHDDERRQTYLVQLLADGLWVHDYVHENPLTSAQREAMTQQILSLIP